jgi:hypothetical protein
LLQIQNPTSQPIVAQIYVSGNSKLTDDRFLPSPGQPYVPVLTTGIQYPVVAPGLALQITDKSGTLITDQNGIEWYAVQRIKATIINGCGWIDGSGDLQPSNIFMNWTAANTNVSGIQIGGMYSQTAGANQLQTLPFFETSIAGNFWLHAPTGQFSYTEIDMAVLEVYQGILAP